MPGSGVGRDGILPRNDIRTVVDYVQSLSNADDRAAVPAERIAAGAEIFANNCASCHGENGAGNMDLGAPNLTDDFWIYGGDDETMFETIWNGRQGWMPAWEGRLTETERKIITVYLLRLRQEAAR